MSVFLLVVGAFVLFALVRVFLVIAGILWGYCSAGPRRTWSWKAAGRLLIEALLPPIVWGGMMAGVLLILYMASYLERPLKPGDYVNIIQCNHLPVGLTCH